MEELIVNQQIFNEVVTIVGKHAKNQEALKTIGMETDISTDLLVNSARFVDIILDFEDKYDVQISDESADQIRKIGDCVNLIEKLIH
jgi:acyl carrier protein